MPTLPGHAAPREPEKNDGKKRQTSRSLPAARLPDLTLRDGRPKPCDLLVSRWFPTARLGILCSCVSPKFRRTGERGLGPAARQLGTEWPPRERASFLRHANPPHPRHWQPPAIVGRTGAHRTTSAHHRHRRRIIPTALGADVNSARETPPGRPSSRLRPGRNPRNTLDPGVCRLARTESRRPGLT